jgi:hypothetical protein
MYKICVYIPEDALEAVKTAMFKAGAGVIDNYDHCAWQCLGTGQFRPLRGSHPERGQIGDIEQLAEYKVELVCSADAIDRVIAQMVQAHPYEVPAYQFWRVNQK